MSDYIVRWKHVRCYPELDIDVQRIKQRTTSVGFNDLQHEYDAGNWFIDPHVVREQIDGPTVSLHGGKTECAIMQVDEDYSFINTYCIEVASAETICSWRDQFDRRVGRLYSLALALCKLEVDAKTKWDVFMQYGTHPMPYWACEAMADAWKVNDCAAVKQACAEIVASWKATRKAMKRTETNAGIRSLSSCVQGGDSDTMPCGHPRSAMVRGEYWGKDEQGQENYTMWCGACSDEAQQQGEEARDGTA